MKLFIINIGLFFLLCGCSKVQTFEVKGVVREVFPDRKTVKIDHEKIPNYMDAMTMDFEVKNTNELRGLQAGDQIAFRMVVTRDDGWIENIKRTGTQQPVGNAPFNFRRVRDVEPLKVGDVIPNYKFTNELGKAVSLEDFRGKAVGLTFLFTRCPFPTFCPRMAGNVKEAAKLLKANSTTPTNWHFLAITIDPAFDTPKVLRDYAKNYEYDPQRWSFLTGDLEEITAISEQFGLQFYRPDPKQPINLSHNLRTVVLDVEGRVQRIIPENKWEPQELADEIKKAAVSASASARAGE